MSDAPIPKLADANGYDAIVEIVNDETVWSQLAKAACHSFGGIAVQEAGVARVLYGNRNADVMSPVAERFPGTVKPLDYSHEKELRFLAAFAEDVDHAYRILKCPALGHAAKLFIVKEKGTWVRA